MDDAPIIVSGCGRSGTTFAQHLLCAHPRIAIAGQEPQYPFLRFEGFAAELHRAGCTARDRNAQLRYDPPHYGGADPECCRMLTRRLWRDFMLDCPDPAAIDHWGWKSVWTIGKEIEREAVERLFPAAKWIVCLRDPFAVYASAKASFEPSLDLDRFVGTWLETWREAHRAGRFAFRVDCPADRRELHATQLFRFVGADVTPEVRRFVAAWPAVHRLGNHPPVDPAIRRRKLEERPELESALVDLPAL